MTTKQKQPQPVFSFILPTRLRSQMCIRSIASVADKCDDLGCFEFLLAFDEDELTVGE